MGEWAPSISTLSSPTPSLIPAQNNQGDTLLGYGGMLISPLRGPVTLMFSSDDVLALVLALEMIGCSSVLT